MRLCPACVLTPSFGSRFEATIGVCSGSPDCKYPPPPPPPPPPDFFEQVVGVSVEDWIATDTPEALAELLDRRDTHETPDR